MEMAVLPWYWVVFGFALIVSEIFLATFFIIWFGAAAVVVGVTLYLAPEMALMWQVVLWAVLSSLLAVSWFKYFKPRSGVNGKVKITQQDVKGEVGLVLTPPVGDKKGTLRFPAPVFGIDECLISCDGELAIGDRVTVIDINDDVLLVEKY